MSTPEEPVSQCDSPAEERDADVRQAAAIVTGNILVLGSVLLLLKIGYKHHSHRAPRLFCFSEAGLIAWLTLVGLTEWVATAVIALLTALLQILIVAWRVLRWMVPGAKTTRTTGGTTTSLPAYRRITMPGWSGRREHPWHPWSLRFTVYSCAALNFLALWSLVWHTGGGLQSPFAPFLLAPAILGIVVVLALPGLALLAGGATISVLFTDAYSSQRTHADVSASLASPRWGVYASVPLILVFVVTVVRGLGGDLPTPDLSRLRALAWSSIMGDRPSKPDTPASPRRDAKR